MWEWRSLIRHFNTDQTTNLQSFNHEFQLKLTNSIGLGHSVGLSDTVGLSDSVTVTLSWLQHAYSRPLFFSGQY